MDQRLREGGIADRDDLLRELVRLTRLVASGRVTGCSVVYFTDGSKEDRSIAFCPVGLRGDLALLLHQWAATIAGL